MGDHRTSQALTKGISQASRISHNTHIQCGTILAQWLHQTVFSVIVTLISMGILEVSSTCKQGSRRVCQGSCSLRA